MTQALDPARRRTLKLLSGVPLLPIATLGSSSLLAACGGGGGAAVVPSPAPAASFVSAEFHAMAAPSLANAAAMATTSVGSSLDLTLSDGTIQKYKLAYERFFITGEMVADGKGGQTLAGGYYDIDNQPIMDNTGAGAPRHFFSDSPDGTSLLQLDNPTVAGIKGKAVFAVVQFEYTTYAQNGTTKMYGLLPSPIAVLTLDQDQTTGKLSLVKYHNVDTSSVHGLWITCGASLSPWNTHLSSEEYEPDAFAARSANYMDNFSKNLYGGDASRANPYHYGHLPEVTVNPDGSGSIRKHYCMGRISHELVQVMPDNRTVFMGDDATNSGYFVFVADTEKDLSAGTLYVAKVGTGFSIDPAASAAPLTWIKLGHATSVEIEALVDGGISPTDIMDVRSTNPGDVAFKKVVANGKTEWIKIINDKAAAFLETHRYASYVDASMGFSKMEGTTVNIKDKVAYSALQNVVASMVAGDTANVPGNGISVAQELKAGVVMALNLKGGQKDDLGGTIDSEWMPVDTKALILGEDINADALGNTANPDKIANPDNLKFSEKLRTLFIGEDSGQHTNNFLWAYHIDTRKLSRLMSMPAGAEATGLHVVDDLNGWTYIASNFQHAGDSIKTQVKADVEPLIKANYNDKFGAAVGYLTAELTGIKLPKT